jgi:hypothetical protein
MSWYIVMKRHKDSGEAMSGIVANLGEVTWHVLRKDERADPMRMSKPKIRCIALHIHIGGVKL